MVFRTDGAGKEKILGRNCNCGNWIRADFVSACSLPYYFFIRELVQKSRVLECAIESRDKSLKENNQFKK